MIRAVLFDLHGTLAYVENPVSEMRENFIFCLTYVWMDNPSKLR